LTEIANFPRKYLQISDIFCNFAEKSDIQKKGTIVMIATLRYNPRNKLAQNTLNYILSLGVFELEMPVTQKKSWLADDFRAAMKEVQDADKGLVQLQDAEDLLNEL